MTKQEELTERKKAECPRPETLIVPRSIMWRTHEYFFPYWQAGVETACFWFGHDAGDVQIVTTVAAPKLFQTAGNYRIDTAAWPRLIKSFRKQKLTNLAQIHTHPINYRVDHSWYDDAHAYSTRSGSLSLVFPDYGLAIEFDLRSIGVHERSDTGWRRLSKSEVFQRILLVDDFADFRWSIEAGGISSDEW